VDIKGLNFDGECIKYIHSHSQRQCNYKSYQKCRLIADCSKFLACVLRDCRKTQTVLQYPTLIGITFGQIESDNNNRMIELTVPICVLLR